ncbi:MAG: hypothetical protein BLM47_12035 [Candidatus Reconcilbacillus cellulovorans]|uniref:YmaF family protein n=1 Tax=Candidatus Reconcilbacillus cellulovorans TaxID=1906605 RepID=A0A2A6DXE6_9BACL|nr:MAG: hypothetical protein BLM47_12035 [Candidatus Reconcilbacillus cellulovorans]
MEHAHPFYLEWWNLYRPPDAHEHNMSGVTSYDVGHHHRYAGMTEPADDVPGHVHAYAFETSFDDGHTHRIRGVTGPAIPLPDGRHYHVFGGVTTVAGRVPHSHRYGGATDVR